MLSDSNLKSLSRRLRVIEGSESTNLIKKEKIHILMIFVKNLSKNSVPIMHSELIDIHCFYQIRKQL